MWIRFVWRMNWFSRLALSIKRGCRAIDSKFTYFNILWEWKWRQLSIGFTAMCARSRIPTARERERVLLDYYCCDFFPISIRSIEFSRKVAKQPQLYCSFFVHCDSVDNRGCEFAWISVKLKLPAKSKYLFMYFFFSWYERVYANRKYEKHWHLFECPPVEVWPFALASNAGIATPSRRNGANLVTAEEDEKRILCAEDLLLSTMKNIFKFIVLPVRV